MHNIKKQRGMSMIALFLILAVIGIFSLVAIKIFPIYMENGQIVSAMSRLVEKSRQDEMSVAEVRKSLRSRFSIENIKVIDEDYVDIEIQPNGDVLLYLQYEDRTTLFGNVDLIVSFEEEIGVAD
ncbi:hypothetical protein MNBD_GAMMA18-573 [hydrothermal vent metagenome]|uniref:DUF4845 domain-containing protein n=1 Tax=hydrothermal vent metagenome TaxID=652676 RepID=A0A3B0ZF29_9ZZZZ